MSTLYTVTLNDLGSYRFTVAADSPREAEGIAKSVLYEEMTTLLDGIAILKRETEATVEPATELPVRQYRVTGRFELTFVETVPAASAREAERHVRRLYESNCGPFEFEHDGGDLTRLSAEEVRS